MLETFLAYMESKNASDRTVKNYRCNLNAFMKWNTKPLEEVDFTDIHMYMSYMKARGMADSSRAAHVAALKSFWKYLAKLGYRNIMLDVDSPKVTRKLPKIPRQEEVLVSLDEAKDKARDFCIITLFANTGMRVSELANLEYGHITGDTVQVLRKGDKWEVLYLNSDCQQALSNLKGEGKVFRNRFGEPLSVRSIQKLVRKYGSFSPHKYRHFFATFLYGQTKDLRLVQELMGHNNPNTTQIYVQLNNEAKRQAMTAFNIRE